ncbi:MAG: DNA polymerase IV [Bacteroidota bacterium]
MIYNEKRAVVHMDLDTFFVSVERLLDSRLEHRPLIIGGTGGRGVVASCSYETRRLGVRSGMPMKLARRLCPSATIISGDHERYGQYSDLVTEVIADTAPLYEKASIDEFFLDMTGMERFHGAYLWAGELRQRVTRETGLPISFGLATNKMVAKVATNEIKPNGQMEIPRGTEQPFLDPLAVRKLPMVGKKTAEFLSNMGVRKVKTLREIPRDFLQRIMGKPGIALWQRARGIDDTPITPYNSRKSLSSEQTFREDTIDMVGMRATLTRMAERLAFGLRESHKLTACITVKLRYADFNTVTRQARIAYTANDRTLADKALELFDRLYDRRQRVRLLGVRFSHLICGGYQINLFEDTEKHIRLHEAIDKIKHRFGADAVTRASALGDLGRERSGPQANGPREAARRSPSEGTASWGAGGRQVKRGRSTAVVKPTKREVPESIPRGDLWEAPRQFSR